MNIWVVNEAEHIPALTGKGRTMRAGMLADKFSASGEHDVTWWFSTFLHYEKKFYADRDFNTDLKPNLHLRMLHVSHAYQKNISVARILYCIRLGKKLRSEIESADRPDVIYCSWPLIEECFECVRYAKKNRIPVVVDIRDLWPDIFSQPFHGLLHRLVNAAVSVLYGRKTRFVMQNADRIVGVSPASLKLAEKYGRKMEPQDHTMYLAYQQKTADPDLQLQNDVLREYLSAHENAHLAVYFGSIDNRIDNMDILVEAAGICRRTDVCFVICGDGQARQACAEAVKDCNNIIFPGWVNAADISTLSARAAFGILPYHNTEDFVDGLPNKFAEYLSFGLPVLTSLSGLSREILQREACGMYFDSAQALCASIDTYLQDPQLLHASKENALALYHKEFDSDIVYGNFLKELEGLPAEKKQQNH